MFNQNKDHLPPEKVPLLKIRFATDDHLKNERDQADKAFRKKLAKRDKEADQALQEMREQADQSLDDVKEEALLKAQIPADRSSQTLEPVPHDREPSETHSNNQDSNQKDGTQKKLDQENHKSEKKVQMAVQAEQVKSQEVIHEVIKKTENLIDTKERQVDELKDRERLARKKAFLEILFQERYETDKALRLERSLSDTLVRSRDEMLSMISHDLRNLIGAVSMRTESLRELLLTENKPSSEKLELLAGINKAWQVIDRWAGDLIDIASLNEGAFVSHRQDTLISEIIHEVTQVFILKASEKKIEVSIHIPDPDLHIFCDRGRITQVLMNLLDNSFKFTPLGGRIEIKAVNNEDDYCFSVSDTGAGIRKKNQAKIFDRRWHSIHEKGGGSGLGLYICKRIIESHKGKIWVTSQLGKGSTFYFSIPKKY